MAETDLAGNVDCTGASGNAAEADSAAEQATEDKSFAEDAIVGQDIMPELSAALARHGVEGRLFIVADERVAERTQNSVAKTLTENGHTVHTHLLPSGEGSKNLREAERIYHWLAEHRAERKEAILAFGGGVVGDLAGFAAATYLRGMPLIQIPTTLVAQIDSSIGGKVAVDLPEGKNLVGAFYPALVTCIDIRFLETLSQRDLLAGWAEVIKTALLFDPPLFDEIAARGPADLTPEFLLAVVPRCVRWKQRVVAKDPKEQGIRAWLNYGHTIGHALEAATGYQTYLHGEAVAIGMHGAARIAHHLGILEQEALEQQQAVIAQYKLPLHYTQVDPAAIEEAITLDKKNRGGKVRWILLDGIGTPRIESDVPQSLVRQVIEELREG
jgi:3-dehydroquinate synthase